MIKSHTELCITNKFISTILESIQYRKRDNITMRAAITYDDLLERVVSRSVPVMFNNNWDIGKSLAAIPVLLDGTLLDRCHIEDTPINRQNAWGYLYAYLPILTAMLKLDSRNVNANNKSTIKTILNRFESDGVWRQNTISVIKTQVYQELDMLKEYL